MDSLQTGVIQIEHRGDVVLMRLLGEHDSTSKALLAGALAAHAHEATGVVVSLMETQFIDSTTVNVLFRGDAELRKRGKRLVLHVATESIVRRVLEITRLSGDLPTTGSLEEALAQAADDEDG
jgi:anti-anti-sigma factor